MLSFETSEEFEYKTNKCPTRITRRELNGTFTQQMKDFTEKGLKRRTDLEREDRQKKGQIMRGEVWSHAHKM